MISRLEKSPGYIVLAIAASLAYAMYAWLTKNAHGNNLLFLLPIQYLESQLAVCIESAQSLYNFRPQSARANINLHPQQYDYLLSAAALFFYGSFILLISRMFELGSRLRRFICRLALVSMAAPVFDFLTYGAAFVLPGEMLTLTQWPAIVYSASVFTVSSLCLFACGGALLMLPFGAISGSQKETVWDAWDERPAKAISPRGRFEARESFYLGD